MSRRGRTTLRMYLYSIVMVFIAASMLGVVYERARAVEEAGAAASDDASFAAGLAAREVDRDLETTGAAVAMLAANPQLARVFDAPDGCSLDYGGMASFTTGHLDVIAADGTVVCSSRPTTLPGAYGDAEWLASALAGSTISGLVVDGRSGTQVVVVSAPVPGLGVVATFLDLDTLAPSLSSKFGGRRRLEFLVTTTDQAIAVSRSVDPQGWVGADISTTPFADRDGGVPRRDVDGVARFYASAPVSATGWQVVAGVDRKQVVTEINVTAQRDLIVAMGVLLVMGAVALVVSRRIAGPITVLNKEVRLAGPNSHRPPVQVAGPWEVAQLAEAFNRLSADLESELSSTARLVAIVESSRDAIISWTPDGTITTWNPAAGRMYGYTPEQAIGRDLSLIVPPADLGEIRGVHEVGADGESLHAIETRRVRPNGTAVDVSLTVSPIRDQSGAIVALSAVGRDITVAIQAVEALRSSEARKSAILASALDAVITMNGAGVIFECNPAAERMFGYRASDVLGRELMEVLFACGAGDATHSGLYRYLPTGDETVVGRRSLLTGIRADGSHFPAEASVVLVDGSVPTLYTWFISDRTAEVAATAELLSLEDRLHQSQRLESLGQLAGGVAHDFNNLLSIIINYASFVAAAVPRDTGVRSDVDQILAASDRAVALTRQLLKFARREPAKLEVLDLNEVVEGFRSLLTRSVGAGVKLVVDPVGELPPIRADRGQVEQVLINLALNARDAMGGVGVVTFETSVVELAPGDPQRPPTVGPGRYVRLAVIDSGVGMSPEVRARIFEPFFTTKGRSDGTGLGLATVYGIVTELGGDVTVCSEEGVGTTFGVYLPVTTEPVTEADLLRRVQETITAGAMGQPEPVHL